jgi:hypothetical protein
MYRWNFIAVQFKSLLLILLLLSIFYKIHCQDFFPKFTYGGGIGYCIPSVPDFEKFYRSIGGLSYGFSGSVQIVRLNNKRIYSVLQYNNFSMSEEHANNDTNVNWKEHFFNGGGIYCWNTGGNMKVRMWLGGGISLINIRERYIDIISDETIKETAPGLYFELGNAIKISKKINNNQGGEFFINFKYDFCKIRSEGEGAINKNINIGGLLVVCGIYFTEFAK